MSMSDAISANKIMAMMKTILKLIIGIVGIVSLIWLSCIVCDQIIKAVEL